MDISLIKPSLAQQNNGMIASRGISVPATRQSEVVEEPVKVAAVEEPDVRLSEEKRYEAVRQAAQAMFKDAYVVSDRTFTIYKDGAGQFITRFTNLRDGSVTYYPEPEIIQSRARSGQSFVDLDA